MITFGEFKKKNTRKHSTSNRQHANFQPLASSSTYFMNAEEWVWFRLKNKK